MSTVPPYDTAEQTLEAGVRVLLRTHSDHPLRLRSREGRHLEFKQSFNWSDRARYARTLAAFANSDGGTIVFGVSDSPRTIVGLQNARFAARDPADISNYLNAHFAPELKWTATEFDFEGKSLGAIHVPQSHNRPIVCTLSDRDKISEGDIYFRYGGRSERIKYPELQRILLEREEIERRRWMQLLSNVARIGVSDVGLLDLKDGKLTGPTGRLLIDESLLKKIQFIREGRFAEIPGTGQPTLRVIGDVEPISPVVVGKTRSVRVPVAIDERQTLEAALSQSTPTEPLAHLVASIHGLTHYTPVYRFAAAAKLTLAQLRTLVENEWGQRQVRDRLLDRLDGALVQAEGSTRNSEASEARKGAISAIKAHQYGDLNDITGIRVLQAVTHLDRAEVSTDLRELMIQRFIRCLRDLNSNEKTHLRKAVCFIDEALYRPAVLATNI